MAHPKLETQQFARDLIGRHGRRNAARLVGLSVPTLASLAAGLECQAGTIALAEARRAELGSNPPPPSAA